MRYANFPKLDVSWVDPKSLRLYERRARRHSKQKLKKLRRLIAEYGWTQPLIVDERNMVLAGAGRLAVAIEDGMDLVPVIRIDHMSEAQKRAYILADNRIADEASWDREMLRGELRGLIELGYDVELTGFDTFEIDTALSLDTSAGPDDDVDLTEPPGPSIARLGDLWHIGEHRVLCADARDMASYERLLGDERAQMIFTDPPYGCAIAGNVSGLGRVKHEDFVMGAGEQSLPAFAQSLLRPALRSMAAHAGAGAIAFVCSDWHAAPYLYDAAQGVFHEAKNLIVWAKTNAGMGTFYRSQHELIYAFKVSAGPHINNFGLGESGRHRSNVWTYPGANTFRKGRMDDLAAHATVKPKAMVADALRDCSKRGGIILDPFLGSGTTLIACQMTGRIGRGIELDPKFVDVVLRRTAEATGCEPLLDGVTPLSTVAAERGEGDHG